MNLTNANAAVLAGQEHTEGTEAQTKAKRSVLSSVANAFGTVLTAPGLAYISFLEYAYDRVYYRNSRFKNFMDGLEANATRKWLYRPGRIKTEEQQERADALFASLTDNRPLKRIMNAKHAKRKADELAKLFGKKAEVVAKEYKEFLDANDTWTEVTTTLIQLKHWTNDK